MRWFRYFNISAVFPNGLSLTTVRLPSRTASAPTPGSRQVSQSEYRAMQMKIRSAYAPAVKDEK